jgi:hydrogenase nickel incorporation protein HypA/HybF
VHELAIADAVLRIVCAHAGGRRVEAVDLKVGHLRQVVPDALAFSFTLLARGTVAEGAALRIEPVGAGGRCLRCGADGPLGGLPLRCARCGGTEVDVRRGEELLVDALELADDTTAGGQLAAAAAPAPTTDERVPDGH